MTTEDHTVIIFARKERPPPENYYTQAQKDHFSNVQAYHSTVEAISVLKEWYNQDPIETNLSFEDAVRDAKPLPSTRCPLQSFLGDTGGEEQLAVVKRKRNSLSP